LLDRYRVRAIDLELLDKAVGAAQVDPEVCGAQVRADRQSAGFAGGYAGLILGAFGGGAASARTNFRIPAKVGIAGLITTAAVYGGVKAGQATAEWADRRGPQCRPF
jgi:hypothetical protein